MSEINNEVMDVTAFDMLNNSVDPFETSLVETSNAVDIPKKTMSTGTKIAIGGFVGFGAGILAKTAFDVFRAVRKAKKMIAEEEANKAEDIDNVNEEEVE